MSRCFPVQLGGETYSFKFQSDKEYQESWKRVLARNYGANAVCLCPGRGERKLAIKHRESSDTWYLARFSNTGDEHAKECRFYSPAPDRSGMQGYTRDAVEEVDGGLRIKLARGLRVQEPPKEQRSGVSQQRASAGTRKPAMTLLGLLHLLWTEARLNVWYPAMEGKRNLGVINKALRNTAARVSASKLPLDSVLMLAASEKSEAEGRNRAISFEAGKRRNRLLLVSPLARFNPERHEEPLQLPISGPFGMPRLKLPTQTWQRTRQSFSRELAAWKRGSRVMAIAQYETKLGDASVTGEVVEVALMRVTERWIPVDSDHEALIEQRLHDASRSFEKPLRFDAGEDHFFPDFWLIDTRDDVPLEVFGMATPEYLARKAEKTAWLNREYGVRGWWCWDAAFDPQGNTIPEFPPARALAR